MGIRHRDLLKIKVLDVNWNALQKASAVFSGLFEFLVTFKKGQPIVRIAESELQAFRDLLHFVDDQNSLDKSHFTVNRWIDLQKMADKFAVIDCLKFCNTELAKLPINCKQLAELYLDPPPYFSTNLRSSQKIKLAEDYIAQIYRDVKRHWREILCLSPPLFNVIMMDSKLEVQDEETILHLCSQWASDQEGRRGFLDENVFKFVRWSYLSIGKVFEAREMIAGQLFDAKERILMAEGGSDEVGILIANVVLEEMANEVLEKIESGIEYHQESAKHNQSVFTLWDTKYSRECNQVLDKFLWCTRSTALTYMERGYKRDLMYMERDYQRRPIRVNKGVYSEYSTYFELNRNHIRKLLLGQTVESPEFCCCNTQSRFKLFSHCVEIGSENYFGFYVKSLEHKGLKNDFTCKFYVFSKKAAKSEVKKDGYVLKHRENLRSGCVAGSDNLLGLSLVELNSEDSPYFVNKRIFIRVILDTPILTEELDNIIKRLHGSKSGKGRIKVKTAEIQKLFADAENIFLDEPSLLLLNAPIKICGDIRGQYTDLHRIFEVGGYPPSAQYLFLGGYVNRSKQNIETICLLLAYKIKYKNSFYLLRGSQECASMCQECGFDKECKRRFTIRIWETFVECFNSLPVAARVDEKILCMHGGLSKELENLTQIDKIVRPAEVPGRGLLCDLLWADPDRDTQGWGKNDKDATTFGADIVKKFLRKHKLNLICRAHQVVADGYEYFAKKKLLTIFSAPNYLDNNAGAIVSVDKSLECSFQVLEASKNQKLGSSINTKKPATRSCKGEEE